MDIVSLLNQIAFGSEIRMLVEISPRQVDNKTVILEEEASNVKQEKRIGYAVHKSENELHIVDGRSSNSVGVILCHEKSHIDGSYWYIIKETNHRNGHQIPKKYKVHSLSHYRKEDWTEYPIQTHAFII